jgi:hypothetical protein
LGTLDLAQCLEGVVALSSTLDYVPRYMAFDSTTNGCSYCTKQNEESFIDWGTASVYEVVNTDPASFYGEGTVLNVLMEDKKCTALSDLIGSTTMTTPKQCQDAILNQDSGKCAKFSFRAYEADTNDTSSMC